MAIMNFTKTVLSNLVHKPVTTSYPAQPAVYPERSRGHIEIDFDGCILCGICKMSCPSGAITVDKATGTWKINRFDCIQCGYCALKCPKKVLSIVPGYQEPMAEKFEEEHVRPVEKPQETATTEASDNAAPAASGGYPQADLDQCVFCTLCAKKCPAEALTVDRIEKKWELNKDACLSCGLCASNCPKKCISMVSE